MKDNIQILISESVELLKEMVAIPSVSFSEAGVCTLISSWLTEKGVEHRREPVQAWCTPCTTRAFDTWEKSIQLLP